MAFQEIDLNNIIAEKQQEPKQHTSSLNNLVEIDPTEILPRKKKEENLGSDGEITLGIIDKAKVGLAAAVERKKYEFAMRRRAIKQAIAEKKLQDEIDAEINRELTDEEEIEMEIEQEANESMESSSVNQNIKYNFTNKYY